MGIAMYSVAERLLPLCSQLAAFKSKPFYQTVSRLYKALLDFDELCIEKTRTMDQWK